MAMIELPVRFDIPAYSFRTDLDGTIYTLHFNYNRRMNRWMMGIGDAAGNDIVRGIVMLINWPLTLQYTNDAMPKGQFILVDESGEDKNPGRVDLGGDVKLLYQEAE